MATPKQLYYDKRGSILVQNLQSRHFGAYYCSTKEEALDLPDVTEETRYVELEPKAARLYRELAKESPSPPWSAVRSLPAMC